VFARKERNSSQSAVIITVPTVASVQLISCICIFYLTVSRPGEKDESKLKIGLSFHVANDIISK
jgi:hypothetical protein